MEPATRPPEGRVSLIFTDIADSTRTTRALGDADYNHRMRGPHCQRVRDAITAHSGFEIKTIGDAFLIAFENADSAVSCAKEIQSRLAEPLITAQDANGREWTLRIRIGIHTADQELTPFRESQHWDYVGSDLNFAARIESLGAAEQILVSESAHRATSNEYSWYEWSGRRIKSFDRPETLWELLWDGRSRGEPGSRWVPEWFAGETNQYIPRPKLQATILNLFGDFASSTVTPNSADVAKSSIRLVTLHGPGGMGKTRLAIQCAVQAAGVFPDGVCFVSLENLPPTADAVAEHIALAIGLPAGTTDIARLNSALAQKRMLFVLDNYESVDSEEVACFLADLLKATQHLRMIVTGREALKLDDLEQVVAIDDGMEPGEAADLFLSRTRLKKGPDWQPDEAQQEAVQQILDLTGGMPLALELTAAWTARRSLPEIAAELRSRLFGSITERSGRRREQSGRHASLRNCIDYSWQLLTTAEQDALVRLGMFGSGFSPQIAREACGIQQAQEMLDRLQDAALVRRTEIDGRSRYVLLPIIRAYALERLDEHPEADVVRRQFVDWYRQMVHRYGGPLRSLTHSGLTELDSEWQNTVSAAEIGLTLCDNDAVCAMSEDLGEFLSLRGLLSERQRLNQMALEAAQFADDRALEARALNNLGNVEVALRNCDEAARLFEQSLELYRKLDDQKGEAETLNNLGVAHRTIGQLGRAEERYHESLAIYRQFPDHPGLGAVLNNLGVILEQLDRLDEAIISYEESLAIRRAAGDRLSQGKTLNNLGGVYLKRHEYDRARKCFEDAVDIFREFGARSDECRAMCNLGIAHLALGDLDLAEEKLQASLILSQELCDRETEELVRKQLSLVAEARRMMG